MRVKQIISKSKDGNRMEIIGKDINSERTLHIRQENHEWKFFVGRDRNDKRIFLPIIVQSRKEG